MLRISILTITCNMNNYMFPLRGLSGCDDILARFISTYTPLRFVSLIDTSGKLHLITTCNRYQQKVYGFPQTLWFSLPLKLNRVSGVIVA